MNRNIKDVEIINSAIQDGDKRAWRNLYEGYYGAIYAYLGKYPDLRNQEKHDLVQQVFLRLVTARTKPRFDQSRAFYSWLMKAANSATLDYFRKSAQKTEGITDFLEDIDQMTLETPEEETDDGPIEQKVAKVLSTLTSQEKVLLFMRSKGTNYTLIARELGIKENVARTYYARAAAKFKRNYLILEKEEANEKEPV